MRLRTTCEIRTRDAVQRAAAVLEMSEKVRFLYIGLGRARRDAWYRGEEMGRSCWGTNARLSQWARVKLTSNGED